jgi:twitching motility protein PilT
VHPPPAPPPGSEPALPKSPRGSWEPPPWESRERKNDGSAPLPARIPLKPPEPAAPAQAPARQPQPAQRAPAGQPVPGQQRPGPGPAPAAPPRPPQTSAQPQRSPSSLPPPLAPPSGGPAAPRPPAPAAPGPRAAPPPPPELASSPGEEPEPPAEADTAEAALAAPAEPQPPRPVDLNETSRFAALSPRHKVEAWLATMVKSNASDLILRAGGRPSTRIDGRIGFLPGRVPAPGALLEVLEAVMGRDRMAIWNDKGSVDAALQLDGLGRFRINAYKQMGEPAVVVRRISDKAPVLELLELPTQELMKVAMRKRGLVLVTGIAGSGKSTTLAGIIEHMNQNAERHVITLEDPIEVLFTEKRCVLSQREVGIDCSSFHEGLRHALRQSPDVIQIGEMRDRETVSAALDAAETGHLVMSTLHTVNAAQTIDRILGFFPAEQHAQVRTRLSDNLACVLSQRLVPRAAGKGMVPAFELMTQTPRVRELIEKGETGELMRTIEQGATPGLISFNQSLRRLVQQKLVELKDALAHSDRPDELVLALRGITSSSGRGRGESGSNMPRQGD